MNGIEYEVITYADIKRYFKIALRDTRNLKDAVIRTISTIYYKGYCDGMEAQQFHKELCKEEQKDERH